MGDDYKFTAIIRLYNTSQKPKAKYVINSLNSVSILFMFPLIITI